MHRTAPSPLGPTSSSAGRRRFRCLLLVLTSAAATACEVDVGVGVDVADDGSGEVEVAVTLDADAARRVSDLAGQLRVDDLVAAGWVVEGPTPEPDGSVVVTVAKPFARVDDARVVLGEISGADGPIRGLEVRQEQSFLATTYHFEGEVDLTNGVEGFSDEGLRQRLEGSGFGLGTAELERLTGAPVGETFHLEVRTDFPGSLVEGPPAGGGAGEAVWRPELGEITPLEATARRLHVARLAWLFAGASSLVALAVVAGARRHRRRSA